MKSIKKTWKIIGLALVLGILVALFPMSTVFANPLTSVSDTLTSYDTSAAPKHTIVFTTATSIPVGGKIEITFATGFTISSIVDADVAETLTAGNATWAVSGQKLTGTIAGAAVTAGAQSVVIGDGTGGGLHDITSPSTAGTYTINLVTRNASNAKLDSGYCLVQIGAGKAASVTVKTYISATITDNGDTGINFGDLNPGDTDKPEAAQGGATGAIHITVGTEVNATVKVSTEAAGDWSGPSALLTVDKGTVNSSDNTGTDTAMSTSYQQVGSDIGAGTGGTVKVYHWISVPNGTTAGDYSNTYYYKVDTSV